MLNQEIYTPPAEIASKAHVKSLDQYKEMYKKSLEDPVAFWTPILETFTWKNADFRKGAVETRWFPKAETNICFNAVDRHVEAGHGDRIAFFYEGNDVDDQHEAITYAQLLERVHRMANVLKKHGVKRGDRVAVYMPMVLELPIAMLACARIGAIHSVVFGGFSADSLADRIMDSTCKVVITADGVMRGTKRIDLKAITDAAVEHCLAEKSPIDAVLVLERLGSDKCPVTMHQCRDYWLGKEMAAVDAECPVTWMNVEDPLFILYTSGSTGKPKGVQHSTGGYMVYTATTFKYIFDYHEGDVFWCTADCGWITGHSYITYGPMLNGATQVLFEGVPTHPDSGRFWAVVDKYKVTQFYTAPTAIRALMSTGDAHVTKYSRKSLRILGTVGEPINPKAWLWYHRVVGDGRCPIVDTFWQTETGGIVITPLPGATPLKPGSATFPFFGVQPVVLDEEGHEIEGACSGYLAMKTAWPSIMRTVYGDHERFEKTYFTQFKGYYSTGDGCRRDEDGYFWITGRVDDVLNVAGHRLGTAEIESALVHHAKCAEASVVAAPHEIKGQCIYAFVTLMQGVEPSSDVRRELKEQVRREIGPFATPEVIHWASALPKTRSGKIMRRILRKIAEKGKSATEEDFGDTTTLADQSVVEKLMDAIGK